MITFVITILGNSRTPFFWRQINAQSPLSFCMRHVFSDSNIWAKKYKKETRLDIESHWIKEFSNKWKEKISTKGPLEKKKEKFYCLSMFPYPSGKLHMGHVRVYTISDVMAHYHRMNGKEVIHPMGWDAFGLPAENAAILNNLDPAEWTEKNIAYMKQQMMDLNLCFDWDAEISTCHPSYYIWTQYLFVKLFEAGLAYRKKALVNWDPVDKTVLAHEQVDEHGCSWRSGAQVEKKLLEQWFLRATKYTKSLLDTLHEIEEDVGIKGMQQHWIGSIDGCYVDFQLEVDGKISGDSISVFCCHPDLVGEATHINLQSQFLEEISLLFKDAGGSNTTVKDLKETEEGCTVKDINAINPFNDETIPFVIGNHHMESYSKALSVLGVPCKHPRDHEIAAKYNLLIKVKTVKLTKEEALKKIKKLKCGQDYMSSSNLHDWLVSRQRRWGTPIPIVHCPYHGPVTVPEKELPITLPHYTENLDEWKKTTCPKCGRASIKETDTMDTFVDSSWYFMRFTDPQNENEIFSKDKCNYSMPVDLYVGGIEHATLHLYYARFISHFCADIGLMKHREPFKKILAQGIIKGKTYRAHSSGKYLPQSQVEQNGSELFDRKTKEKVDVTFEKMSKSKLNGVDPSEFIAEWGITITRLFVLYAAAPSEVIHWDVKTDIIPGVMRWQMKLWRCVGRLIEARKQPSPKTCADPVMEYNIAQQTNATIKQVTDLFETSCTLSAAITSLMTVARYCHGIKDETIQSSPEYERLVCTQVIMATPMMPHFTSELWTGLQGMNYNLTSQKWNKPVLDQEWPKPTKLAEPQKFRVLVNNKYCTKLIVPNEVTKDEELIKLALLHSKVVKALKTNPVQRLDLRKDKKLINVITDQFIKINNKQ
ncbi:putative leucine--tRNA ligase, mitochondrial [Clavelina lepadiformis]|uniref:putative leucine--tRNA ligase, mitochondrial n=1 Tax=Clavelina lepadiformis TaxID=159417 RepID=UPI004042EC82